VSLRDGFEFIFQFAELKNTEIFSYFNSFIFSFKGVFMKRLFSAILLCLLLLTACGNPTAATTEPPGPSLAGVWVNAGQYSEGRDFVETLTLNADGSAVVHLEYQGKDYATLEGTWTAENGVLNVDFTDPNTRDRSYTYTLTETGLILTGDGKDVEYVRE
jgi:hypothetical protein